LGKNAYSWKWSHFAQEITFGGEVLVWRVEVGVVLRALLMEFERRTTRGIFI
jgi:hypothetical protein